MLIHGGVAFAPYRLRFEERLGRRLDRIEVYPASEGFVAVQTEASGGLTLTLDSAVRAVTPSPTSCSTAVTPSC